MPAIRSASGEGLLAPPVVREVQTRGTSRKDLPGRRGRAVTHHERDGRRPVGGGEARPASYAVVVETRSEASTLEELTSEIVGCMRCPRLVAWRGKRWRPPHVRRVRRTGLLGRVRCRDSETRMPGSVSSVWPRRRTAGTAPGVFSRVTAPETGSTRRCGVRGSPTNRRAPTAHDGLHLDGAYVTATVRCAPPKNLPSSTREAELRGVPSARGQSSCRSYGF